MSKKAPITGIASQDRLKKTIDWYRENYQSLKEDSARLF